MDVPNVLSKYNLLLLSLSNFVHIYLYLFWLMYLAEVDHPLIFGVSLGLKLINTVGLFWEFNC